VGNGINGGAGGSYETEADAEGAVDVDVDVDPEAKILGTAVEPVSEATDSTPTPEVSPTS